LKHKGLKTTLAKAKALRKFVEPIKIRAKEDTMHNRRMAFRYLREKEAVKVII
jgi:large subunit ribosomal protein L17